MAAVRYSKPTLRRRPDYVISTEKEYVSQTMMMKPNTTAYDPDYGVMKGTTKFMPQRAWNSVGHNNGNWSRQTADLVGHMSSPPAKKTNTPAFQPKYSGCAVNHYFIFLFGSINVSRIFSGPTPPLTRPVTYTSQYPSDFGAD